MRLTGQRCTVRLWKPGDADALARHGNNANVARQLRDRFPHPYTRAHAVAFIRHASALIPPTHFAIEVDDEAAGAVGFVAGTDVERFSAEIGYWVGEAHWGKGVATEALTLVTGYAFDTCHLLRLFALPFADNAASVRVLEKAGYVREGRLASSAVKHGAARDQFIYARINPNWRFS